MSTQIWARLAVVLAPAPGIDAERWAATLSARRSRLLEAAGAGAELRLGRRCADDPLASTIGEARRTLPVEAAVELTTPGGELAALAERAGALGAVLADIMDPSGSALTIGIMQRIIPAQRGEIFLSLMFRRSPGTTVEAFRSWWLTQHAPLCVPLLLPEMLAYDQVHVDQDASRRAAQLAGIPHVPYDAYDNLTWSSRAAFLASVSKPGNTARIQQDDIGHIDPASRRGSLMRML